MAHANTQLHMGFPLLQRFKLALEEFKTGQELRKRYLETYRELNSLNDKELNDIGISRYDISAIAREHVYGR